MSAYSNAILATTGLDSYYRLNETSGTTVADSKGTNNLTCSGGFTLGNPGIPSGETCLSLNGSTGYASGNLDPTLNRNSCTAEFWFKRNNITNTAIQVIMMLGSANAAVKGGFGFSLNRGLTNGTNSLWMDVPAHAVLGINDSGGQPVRIADTNWHHFAAVMSTASFGTVKVYIDGLLAGTRTSTDNRDTGADSTYIGQDGNSANFFDGEIAHLAIYNVELDSATIANHYTLGNSLPGIANVSAITSFLVSPTAASARDLTASASTQFIVSHFGHTQWIAVSALSIFLASGDGSSFTIGNKEVAAGTAISISYVASAAADRPATAATRLILVSGCGEYVSPILVSASSGLRLGVASTSVSLGDKPVAASSAINVSSSQSYTRLAVYSLVASSGIALAGQPSLAADRIVSASSAFTMDSSGRQSRDLFVSASTGLGLAADPDSNQFYQIAAATTVTFVSAASLAVAGTEAESRLVLVDRAFATVWLPWRRGSLGLSPGGNLPHS